jgi:hypothetical protein
MEALGETLDRLLPGMTAGQKTARSQSCNASSGSMILTDRMDDAALTAMLDLAAAPLPAPELCSRDHFNQCLLVMLAVLPKRNSDAVSGKLLIAAYQKKLGSYPHDQISYLADQATCRCEWFPSIAECISIMGGWQRNDEAVRIRRGAQVAARQERQARFDDIMAALAAGSLCQADVDALDSWSKEVGETRGYLRRQEDGTYVSRVRA